MNCRYVDPAKEAETLEPKGTGYGPSMFRRDW